MIWKRMKIYLILATIGSILLWAGCTSKSGTGPPSTLGDLAPTSNGNLAHRVIIPEIDGDAVYLVLGTYGGNSESILLLRERVTGEQIIYNEQFDSSYYGDSVLDKYLNTDFWNSLTEDVQSQVLETRIEVTAKSSVWIAGRDKEFIVRKIFALSMVECGDKPDRTPLTEGVRIPYLAKLENRIAVGKVSYVAPEDSSEVFVGDEMELSWWTRTPDTRNALVWIISCNGYYDITQVDIKMGVRPAFCLNAGLRVTGSEKDGQTVYLLSF